MKKYRIFQLVAAIFLLSQFSQFGLARVRNQIKIPDIPGYKTLKCDFHMHTVFSDGKVWPTVRTDEAWREGLDAIFLKDVEKLSVETWRDAIKAAADQGAFIFWNHPGWKGQQKDGIARWYDEHTEILTNGMMHGIEVVNGRSYYPEAHQWCIDKKLTMLSNSDIHEPINMDYNLHAGDHRPMTLVFAKDNSEDSIKEALFDRRTVVYSGNMLVGEEKFLKPIFDNSITIDKNYLELAGMERKNLQISNTSEIDYDLKLTKKSNKISVPENITLYGETTVLFRVSATSTNFTGTVDFELPYEVMNLKTEPKKGLPVKIKLKVKFN